MEVEEGEREEKENMARESQDAAEPQEKHHELHTHESHRHTRSDTDTQKDTQSHSHRHTSTLNNHRVPLAALGLSDLRKMPCTSHDILQSSREHT